MQVFIRTDSIGKIVKDLGVNKTGNVQMFVTSEISRLMEQYMPFVTGAFIKGKRISNPTTIDVVGPQAGYLYYGNKMVNAKTGKGPMLIPDVGFRYKSGTVLKPTNIPLNYDKTKNPKAGPYWDKRMMAEKESMIVRETERYVEAMR